jgi:hypothetical protein
MTALWVGAIAGLLVGGSLGAVFAIVLIGTGAVDRPPAVDLDLEARKARAARIIKDGEKVWQECAGCGRWTSKGRWCSDTCHRDEDGHQ